MPGTLFALLKPPQAVRLCTNGRRVDFGRTCRVSVRVLPVLKEQILSPVVLWLPCCIPDTTCLVLKGDIVLFSQSLSSLNIDKLVLWKILLIDNVGIKLRPRGSFDNFLLNALIEVSEYANKLLMFSLILWPQLSYLFPQMRDSLIKNAVHEPHQVTKLGWPISWPVLASCSPSILSTWLLIFSLLNLLPLA